MCLELLGPVTLGLVWAFEWYRELLSLSALKLRSEMILGRVMVSWCFRVLEDVEYINDSRGVFGKICSGKNEGARIYPGSSIP